ncbi:hypothetical protein BT67DRAFT_477658 [Trichocladium antarcticum]|uniref:Uncharacterized protein n=1 Tax=Trichocladium antarcticum TaxID=1450529 RepID=A0AAN6UJB5_9PEZI|nr:hypothetical protein BT67DRAFT_477658 [Trichocladium antarcticum]
MQNLTVHTAIDNECTVHASFDLAFLALDNGEEKRASEPARPPNERYWRLEYSHILGYGLVSNQL